MALIEDNDDSAHRNLPTNFPFLILYWWIVVIVDLSSFGIYDDLMVNNSVYSD